MADINKYLCIYYLVTLMYLISCVVVGVLKFLKRGWNVETDVMHCFYYDCLLQESDGMMGIGYCFRSILRFGLGDGIFVLL